MTSNIDSTIEAKIRDNLQWSLIFFIFNYIANEIDENHDEEEGTFQRNFFKQWRKFTSKTVVNKDLDTINSILTTPKNLFYSILQNQDSGLESTEMYQEKYNKALKTIEEFYIKNTTGDNNGNGENGKQLK